MYSASKKTRKISPIIAALGLAFLSAGPAAFAEEESANPVKPVTRGIFNSQTMPPEVMRAMRENMKLMQKFRGVHVEEKPDLTEERLRRYPLATDFNFAYIDKTGNIKLETALLTADSFHDGVAIVCPGKFHRVDGQWEMEPEQYNPRQSRKALLRTDGTVSFLKPFEAPVGQFDKDGPGTGLYFAR